MLFDGVKLLAFLLLLSLSVDQEVSKVRLNGRGLISLRFFPFGGQLELFSVEIDSLLLLGFLHVPVRQLQGEEIVEFG